MVTRLYSQHDPSFEKEHLGKSRLTIHGWGCFVVSLANLYQVHPLEILAIPGAITADGLVVSKVVASDFGGEALPARAPNSPPQGWCIAQTDFYRNVGYDTHFFCVHPQLHLQVDPLNFPAKYEAIRYPIVNYRPFTGVSLNILIPQEQETLQRRLFRLLARLTRR